jgi:hypothetical protein
MKTVGRVATSQTKKPAKKPVKKLAKKPAVKVTSKKATATAATSKKTGKAAVTAKKRAKMSAATAIRVSGEFPRVVTLHQESGWTLSDTAAWVTKQQKFLVAEMLRHGAVLFRGFPLEKDTCFDRFVCSFKGWEDLSYEESLSFAVRTRRSGRVCTTNDGKNGGLLFHHEQAQAPRYPSKVFFFCEMPAAPGTGGATGLSRSDRLLQRLEAVYPQFAKDCAEKGVKYSFTVGDENDISKGAGRSWKSYFSVNTRAELRARLDELGYTYTEYDTTVHVTTPILSAVRVAPGTETRVFFNQMVATLANAVEFMRANGGFSGEQISQTELDMYLRFGDDSSVPIEPLIKAREWSEEHAVDLQWQKGDVALIDNFIAMHARRLWSGENGQRVVLASLVK